MIELATSNDVPTAPPSKTILLVEDDPILRRLVRRVLQTLDYQLLEAPNGAEAVKLASEQETPIDLMVTDIMMPAMDGFELAEQFSPLHPETRVLFLTGYADDSAFVRRGLRKSGYSYLLKPFTQDALTRRIKELLRYPAGVVPMS